MINTDLFGIKKNYSPKNDEIITIKNYNRIKDYVDGNSIFIGQFPGFPYIDINLSYIFSFSYINIAQFLIIYLFSLLEFKFLFFSPNFIIINNLMYLLNILSFPFMEIGELGQIYSVSKEEILDSNKIINNYFIGVNCSFNKCLDLPKQYKNHFIINIDPSEEYPFIEIYYKGVPLYKYNSSDEIVKLFNYLIIWRTI